jgi:hypothetical protein
VASAHTNGRGGGCLIAVYSLTTVSLPSFRLSPTGMAAGEGRNFMDSNLVDSASSHTLVSKIKPCMSKYKSLTLKLRTAHYISYNLFDSPLLLG